MAVPYKYRSTRNDSSIASRDAVIIKMRYRWYFSAPLYRCIIISVYNCLPHLMNAAIYMRASFCFIYSRRCSSSHAMHDTELSRLAPRLNLMRRWTSKINSTFSYRNTFTNCCHDENGSWSMFRTFKNFELFCRICLRVAFKTLSCHMLFVNTYMRRQRAWRCIQLCSCRELEADLLTQLCDDVNLSPNFLRGNEVSLEKWKWRCQNIYACNNWN